MLSSLRYFCSLQVGLPSVLFGFAVGGCTKFIRVFHFLVCSSMEAVGYKWGGGLSVGALASRTSGLCGCAVLLRVCRDSAGRIQW